MGGLMAPWHAEPVNTLDLARQVGSAVIVVAAAAGDWRWPGQD
jgi:hypothetical protein